MNKDIVLIEKAYLLLLQLPPSCDFRAFNQDIYARLRDAIAADWNDDVEYVQNLFEEVALHPQRIR